MDTQRRTLIITGLVLLLILSIIFITIFYLVRTASNRRAQNTAPNTNNPAATATPQATTFPRIDIAQASATPSASPLTSATPNRPTTQTPAASQVPAAASPSPSPAGTNSGQSSITQTNSNTKTYNGGSFQLEYFNNWGVLTCNNSSNFEFDPTNSADLLNASCDFAVKPVTFLVNRGTGCRGETITLGGHQVVKQVQTLTNGVNYKWCVKSNPSLEVSHRYSTTGGRATSNKDFSKEVEQIIATLKITAGS